jgi:hypothetical protein
MEYWKTCRALWWGREWGRRGWTRPVATPRNGGGLGCRRRGRNAAKSGVLRTSGVAPEGGKENGAGDRTRGTL